jgi:membrane protease YdiL (CAAX protease family)
MQSVGEAQARLPASGWYPDPAGRWRLRWWDGESWTEGVSDGARIAEEVLPGSTADADGRARLPFRAIWWALGGIVAGELIGGVFAVLADLASNDRYVVELIASQLGLWTGFAGAIYLVSRRYATGHPFRDFGVRMQRTDPGWALLFSLAMRVVAVVAVIPLVLAFQHYFKHVPKASPLDGHDNDLGAQITISVIAAIGAPFIEEILFRGVIMGSLQRFGSWWAIIVQGLLFGAVHMTPEAGRANFLTFIEIGIGGMGLGWIATRYRRLGPGMWTHFFFNLQAVALLPFS